MIPVRFIATPHTFDEDDTMQRVLSLSLATGAIAFGVWAVLRRLRAQQSRRDLGTVSDAWLHDSRSYSQNVE